MSAPQTPIYVDVAVPVPLRRTFTYRVPSTLTALQAGSRVAVPFARRKLAAYVLGPAEPPPPDVRVKDVAGVIDPHPVFAPELLAFLREAADYYMHPLGEVLRAAAPALPSDAMRALRQEGFLEREEHLPGSRVGTRRTLVARLRGAPPEGIRLGKNQRVLLQLLSERDEVTIDELRSHLPNPRVVIQKLATRGLIDTEEREVVRDRFLAGSPERDTPPVLKPAQAAAVDAMVARLGEGGGFLLQGVTGSGKTEVYLRLIAAASERGLGALMLVPEIALTPQLVSRLRARFGDALAVLHSELSERERHDAWRALRDGRIKLAIGARSALFAPVHDLGVIVVDEEHDASFKQEEGFRYHARDMALLRAHRARAVCVLGSATPSLESHELAHRGRLELLRMDERATPRSLPGVEIVDLRRHRRGPSPHRWLSGPLHQALERCLAAREQAILFLNRRGFAPSVQCEACGELLQCPACSVALTAHRGIGLLRCHYCDFATPRPERCPECGEAGMRELGIGTEQVEQALREVFPGARIGRLDRDTASGRGVEEVLGKLRRGELDVLVGTQMVTKGHDVSGVTLVGVVAADQSLGFPDLRAAERTFQLLTQVAGRAGRGEREGRVLLQTYQPDVPALRHAATHDYDAFCAEELQARREHGYPPFGRLVAVRIDAGSETSARDAARALAHAAERHPAVRAGKVHVLGPAPALIARVRARHRFRILLSAPERPALREVARAVERRIEAGLGPARASLDIDPISML